VLGPYRRVLAVPGGAAFSLAGFVARLPIAMQTLGIVLLVAATRGSYGLAGGVSATFLISGAVAAPVLGRLTDRLGQGRVLLAALAGHTVGLGALLALALAGAPAWTLFPAAVVAGASYAQPGSLVRARWSHMLAGTPLLPTALSWESVVDEVIFVVGPVLVTALATGIAPAAGLLTAYGFTLVGCLALAVQRRTEPPAHPVRAGGRGNSALLAPGVLVLVGAAFGLGSIFGSVEVATVAFTAERGRPAAAGVVLALLAGGSLLAGLWYGTVAWRAPVHRRFVLGVLALAAATVPLPFAPNVVALAVLVFVGGFAISPALIAGFGLLDRLVPPRARTEGLAWFSTGLGIGLAVSSSIAGQVVDAASGRAALGVTVAAGGLSAVLVLLGARRLQPRADPPTGPPPPDPPLAGPPPVEPPAASDPAAPE
jgi:MFS family permease